jgi:hypothetical protein
LAPTPKLDMDMRMVRPKVMNDIPANTARNAHLVFHQEAHEHEPAVKLRELFRPFIPLDIVVQLEGEKDEVCLDGQAEIKGVANGMGVVAILSRPEMAFCSSMLVAITGLSKDELMALLLATAVTYAERCILSSTHRR